MWGSDFGYGAFGVGLASFCVPTSQITKIEAEIRRIAQQDNVLQFSDGSYRIRCMPIGRVDASEQKIGGVWVRGYLAATVGGPVFRECRQEAILAVLTGGVCLG